jgi:hypothetical protein
VHQVKWLHAKATFNRAHEEQILVRYEMKWTVAYFGHHADDWTGRKQQASSPGHRIYAAQQEAMWRCFKIAAQESFMSMGIEV